MIETLDITPVDTIFKIKDSHQSKVIRFIVVNTDVDICHSPQNVFEIFIFGQLKIDLIFTADQEKVESVMVSNSQFITLNK